MKFNNFLHSLELAKSSKINLLGFLCGRSIWQDSIDIFCQSNQDNFLDWLNLEGRQRVKKLKNALTDTLSYLENYVYKTWIIYWWKMDL